MSYVSYLAFGENPEGIEGILEESGFKLEEWPSEALGLVIGGNLVVYAAKNGVPSNVAHFRLISSSYGMEAEFWSQRGIGSIARQACITYTEETEGSVYGLLEKLKTRYNCAVVEPESSRLKREEAKLSKGQHKQKEAV
ncbi:MAG TPA: hypothetical protein VJG30_02430 [Candidatus Nanoarchaeia archaeon]|nr:hypothetical protein [Candidatus Nanoarchaeia archaeon]